MPVSPSFREKAGVDVPASPRRHGGRQVATSGMEIEQLKHLVAAIEHRSLVKAADTASISQSGLSRSLQSLERRLGVPLLSRGPRGVEPTIYALAILERAKVIIDEVAGCIEDIRSLERKTAS